MSGGEQEPEQCPELAFPGWSYLGFIWQPPDEIGITAYAYFREADRDASMTNLNKLFPVAVINLEPGDCVNMGELEWFPVGEFEPGGE